MKIHIFTYVFYPETFLINELAFTLAQKGHEVDVSTSLPNYESKQLHPSYGYFRGPYFEKSEGVQIFRFPVLPRKVGLFHLALNYFSNLVIGSLNAFRLKPAQVSLCFGVSPIFLVLPALFRKFIFGTPVVIWLQDPWPETFASVVQVPPHHFSYRALQKMVKWIYAHTDLIMIQSRAYLDHLKNHNYKGRIELIPNWAPSRLEEGEKVPVWVENLPTDHFILTFAGNVGRGQSLDQLLKAIKGLQSRLTVVIVGDGTEHERLKAYVETEKIQNVIFCGRKPMEDMSALFKVSSCLYVSLSASPLSSLTVPSKLQAYMSVGKPILASLSGEGARIVNEAECGYVSPPEDVKELKTQIEKFLSLSEEELKKLGKNAKEYYARHFEKQKLIDRVEALLKEVAQ